jgi:hypothetical protein
MCLTPIASKPAPTGLLAFGFGLLLELQIPHTMDSARFEPVQQLHPGAGVLVLIGVVADRR